MLKLIFPEQAALLEMPAPACPWDLHATSWLSPRNLVFSLLKFDFMASASVPVKYSVNSEGCFEAHG